MSYSREGALARRIIAVLSCLIVLALGVLIWALSRYALRRQEQAAVPPTSEPMTVTATATPEPVATAEPTTVPTPEPSPTPGPSPTPELIAPPVELAETELQSHEYLDDFVFLGDSTTFGMGAYGVLPFTQIWVPASGTLALFNQATEFINYYAPDDPYNAVELSIADCAARGQPKYLVITLGINGIAFLDEYQFKGYYTSLIQSIQAASPDTKIICHSIYPVIDSKAPGGINNAGVNAANGWIYDVAEETGTRYLNSHDLLMDNTGNLRADYNNGDDTGIHLNTAGFDVVLNNIRTHAYQ